MSQDFTVTKQVKETKSGTKITIDIKKTSPNATTISGNIEDVIAELNARLENQERK